MDRRFRRARHWSNAELKKYAGYWTGDIVNVSANKDADKEGGFYKDYFKNKTNYFITNYGGTRGESGNAEEIKLDLTKELPENLKKRFDVCFNHTTLEHIFEIQTAFKNICDMAREAVILIVPWVQEVHVCDAFLDYWRISPYAMEKMYEENDYTMVVCNYNNSFNCATYLFCIGIRKERLKQYPQFGKVKLEQQFPVAGCWIGRENGVLRLLKSVLKMFYK